MSGRVTEFVEVGDIPVEDTLEIPFGEVPHQILRPVVRRLSLGYLNTGGGEVVFDDLFHLLNRFVFDFLEVRRVDLAFLGSFVTLPSASLYSGKKPTARQ